MAPCWFQENRHRLCCVLFVLCRIIFKRDATEAVDVWVVATQSKKSATYDERLAVLTAFWCHVLFATEGGKMVSAELRKHRGWTFSKKTLHGVRQCISDLEMKDQRNISDLSVTLTGTAYIDRLLKSPNSSKLVQECNQTLDALCDLRPFRALELSFTTVYGVVSKFPLYGKHVL